MHIESHLKLDFSDVLIRPKRSTLTSRADVDITRTFRFRHTGAEWTGFPLIASNMDTIGTISMARALFPSKAMVALHKYYPADKLVEFFKQNESQNAFYTMGMTEEDREKFVHVKSKVRLPKLSVDVANGYTEIFLSTRADEVIE